MSKYTKEQENFILQNYSSVEEMEKITRINELEQWLEQYYKDIATYERETRIQNYNPQSVSSQLSSMYPDATMSDLIGGFTANIIAYDIEASMKEKELRELKGN